MNSQNIEIRLYLHDEGLAKEEALESAHYASALAKAEISNNEMKIKNIGKSLLIALGSIIIDQIYHISIKAAHQIFTIFIDPSTIVYIGTKFLFVFVISMIVLNIKTIKNKYLQSVTIALVAAFLFSILLNYMFPNLYNIIMHMSHALAIFIASWFVLSFIKK